MRRQMDEKAVRLLIKFDLNLMYSIKEIGFQF